MYTVVRFEASKKNAPSMMALGSSLNRIKRNTFEGRDKVPNRFSCSVCTGEDWGKHLRSIARFLTQFSSVIRKAGQIGVRIEFDVAIEPEDLLKRPYLVTRLPIKLIEELANKKVEISFTYYSGASGG